MFSERLYVAYQPLLPKPKLAVFSSTDKKQFPSSQPSKKWATSNHPKALLLRPTIQLPTIFSRLKTA
jgi:hypothetical protein